MFKLYIKDIDLIVYADRLSTILNVVELARVHTDVTATSIERVEKLPYFNTVIKYTTPGRLDNYINIFNELCKTHTLFIMAVVKDGVYNDALYYADKEKSNSIPDKDAEDALYETLKKLDDLQKAVIETFYYIGKKETNAVDGIFHIFEKIENLKTTIKLIKECGSDNLVRLDPLNESENQNKCTKDNNRWNRAAPTSLGSYLARCSCNIPRDFISIDEQRLNQIIAKAVSESIRVLQPYKRN